MTDCIVIAYNNVDITTRAVASVLLHGPAGGRRIILVDNASTDGGFAELGALLQELGHSYIRLGENIGPYGAANAGISAVKTEKFLFMCNDCALYPAAADRLLAALSPEHPVVGATEINSDIYLSPPDTTEMYLYPGGFFTCFAAVTRAARAIGEFDTRYALTFGDTDWEQRYADAGFVYVLHRGAQVFHGRSVGRKRTGIAHDMSIDSADHKRFLEKWAARKDVTAKHPFEDQDRKRAFLEQEWKKGEQ